MQKFGGIRADTEATGAGLAYVVNGRYALDGELQRRYGLSQGTAKNGTVIANAWSAANGAQILLFTSAGAIELVTL